MRLLAAIADTVAVEQGGTRAVITPHIPVVTSINQVVKRYDFLGVEVEPILLVVSQYLLEQYTSSYLVYIV